MHSRRRGFTLVELMLVLIILSVLAAIVVPKLVGTRTESNIYATKGQIGMFKEALGRYAFENFDKYPTSEQGLNALVQQPTSPPVPKKWKGPFLDGHVPMDPWDNPYKYMCPGKNFPDSYDVWSLGPDGADGTEDDIGNWNLQ